jgi:hypothetical protein
MVVVGAVQKVAGENFGKQVVDFVGKIVAAELEVVDMSAVAAGIFAVVVAAGIFAVVVADIAVVVVAVVVADIAVVVVIVEGISIGEG